MADHANYEGGIFKGHRSGRNAVVLGGSMAGLLAARVLTDFFDQVTLIERDALPRGAENRKGVPQGRHLHALLTRGEQILSRLFPGLPDELEVGGATRCDIPGDVLWYQYGGYKLRFESGITVLSMSRPFLESAVRRRVLALPNLRAELMQQGSRCDSRSQTNYRSEDTTSGIAGGGNQRGPGCRCDRSRVSITEVA